MTPSMFLILTSIRQKKRSDEIDSKINIWTWYILKGSTKVKKCSILSGRKITVLGGVKTFYLQGEIFRKSRYIWRYHYKKAAT